MTDKIKLDIVSDVVCPWCIIGYKRLETAITEMGLEDKVELTWHPFELNPTASSGGENRKEHLMRKYGMSADELARNQENLSNLGAELGFTFDFYDEQPIVNTRDAHILIDMAGDKQTDLELRLFSAYFSERKDISDRQILGLELQAIGLNWNEVAARLDESNVRDEIQTQEEHWQSLGVSAVPTVIFNDTQALTGAQPVEVYKQVLTELV